jgi:hypothetical protein
MRPIVLAVIAGIGLAAGLTASAEAATLVKKHKAAPTPGREELPHRLVLLQGQIHSLRTQLVRRAELFLSLRSGDPVFRPHGGGRR